ncbi:hypothetical protein MNB_SV-6-191 [hydrothermal vent metagenome]|uniref:Uncharacterized protein n=1 Tax=hydrothermal vent metagenome TaxID=652676 RepID=A0A1W1BGN1_9ZZZZ
MKDTNQRVNYLYDLQDVGYDTDIIREYFINLNHDDSGCNTVYCKGADKIASVLNFGILSACIHQSLKLVT